MCVALATVKPSDDLGKQPQPPPPVEAAYGLDELLAVAGLHLGEEFSPRTVRLYATQCLIDRPGKKGRSAVYGQRHLLQLLLIRSLARRGLSLAAIAPLCGLPDPELEQQLAQLEAQAETKGEAQGDASPQESNEALAYLRTFQSSAMPFSPLSSPPTLSPAATTPLSAPVPCCRCSALPSSLAAPAVPFLRPVRPPAPAVAVMPPAAGIVSPWRRESSCRSVMRARSLRLAPVASPGCSPSRIA